MLYDLRELKLDENMTAHENVNNVMETIESLSILGEGILPQNAKNMFINIVIDLDYENIRTILKISKRNALLTEHSQDVKEREDDLERHSSHHKKLNKIRRTFETKICP